VWSRQSKAILWTLGLKKSIAIQRGITQENSLLLSKCGSEKDAGKTSFWGLSPARPKMGVCRGENSRKYGYLIQSLGS